MEIALILVLIFVAYVYFSAGKKHTLAHKTFSLLLVVVLVHLAFDAATIYTVGHLDNVPVLLNDMLHRIFMGTMVLTIYLFYQYISILVEEETGQSRRLDLPAKVFSLLRNLAACCCPLTIQLRLRGIIRMVFMQAFVM